jgi:hypothetical protein
MVGRDQGRDQPLRGTRQRRGRSCGDQRIPRDASNSRYGMALGPDGNLWCTEYNGNNIVRDFVTDRVFWSQTTGEVEFWLMSGTTRWGRV